MITLNLDRMGFTSKPTGAAIGGVRNRLARPDAMQTIDPAELLAAIERGQSFTPAAMTGGSGDTWQSQQVIVADIDNDTGTKDAEGHKIRLAEPLTPDEARAALAEHGITPYAMYWTFSNRPDWPKFRIVLILDAAIADPEAAKELTARLAHVLNAAREHCTDTSMADTARLLFGGRPDCVFYWSGQTTPAAQLWSLPAAAAPEAAPAAERPPMERPRVERRKAGTLAELQDRLDDDIKSFDLARFMEYDGGRLVKRGKNTFINPCPICHHRDCMQVTGSVWHCHSSNHSGINSGTIIDYLMARDGLTTGDALDNFKYSIMGYDRDEWKQAYISSRRSTAAEDFQDLDAPIDYDGEIGEPGDVEAEPRPVSEALADAPADYTDYLRRCVDILNGDDVDEAHFLMEHGIDAIDLAYANVDAAGSLLYRFGISNDTAKMCSVGYDPERGALIVPSTTAHYVAVTEAGTAQHVGKPAIMGEPVLYSGAEFVYVCADALAALSVIEAGRQAIAVYDNACVARMLKLMEKRPTPATLIICIGGSEARNKAADRLKKGLQRLNVSYLDAPSLTGDLNAALVKDRAAFETALNKAMNAEREQRTGAGMIDAFLEAIQTHKYEPLPTCIGDVDRAIGGGFIRQQLILLGAAPGVGKTAFAQWLFEGFAKRGTDCIYLNLEMSREQMLARSFARIAAKNGTKIKTTSVLQGYKWTDAERTAIMEVAEEYKQTIAPHLIYNPDNVSTNLDAILSYIEKEAERAKKEGKTAPLCVLDYLQMITGGEHEDEKNLIKRAVKGLKDYAIRHNTVVFVIIAHNRESNKKGTATMEAGRDTSNLEYSADLQLALSYTKCVYRAPDNKQPSKPEHLTEDEKRLITLQVTKGRFGGAGRYADLHFNGETMTYTQVAKDFIEVDEPTPWTSKPGDAPIAEF